MYCVTVAGASGAPSARWVPSPAAALSASASRDVHVSGVPAPRASDHPAMTRSRWNHLTMVAGGAGLAGSTTPEAITSGWSGWAKVIRISRMVRRQLPGTEVKSSPRSAKFSRLISAVRSQVSSPNRGPAGCSRQAGSSSRKRQDPAVPPALAAGWVSGSGTGACDVITLPGGRDVVLAERGDHDGGQEFIDRPPPPRPQDRIGGAVGVDPLGQRERRRQVPPGDQRVRALVTLPVGEYGAGAALRRVRGIQRVTAGRDRGVQLAGGELLAGQRVQAGRWLAGAE